MLTTDEDRERKARLSAPGTFNVVLNPTSFYRSPECAERLDDGRASSTRLQCKIAIVSADGGVGSHTVVDSSSAAGDIDLVILPRFEDFKRQPTTGHQSPTSSPPLNRSAPRRKESLPVPVIQSPEVAALRRFQDVVSKQLIPSDCGCELSIIVLDEAAKRFPPVGTGLQKL